MVSVPLMEYSAVVVTGGTLCTLTVADCGKNELNFHKSLADDSDCRGAGATGQGMVEISMIYRNSEWRGGGRPAARQHQNVLPRLK